MLSISRQTKSTQDSKVEKQGRAHKPNQIPPNNTQLPHPLTSCWPGQAKKQNKSGNRQQFRGGKEKTPSRSKQKENHAAHPARKQDHYYKTSSSSVRRIATDRQTDRQAGRQVNTSTSTSTSLPRLPHECQLCKRAARTGREHITE